MKKLLALILPVLALCYACDDDITYAEQREKEIKQIAAFLQKGCKVMDTDNPTDTLLYVPGGIITISEEELQYRINLDNDTTENHVDFWMAPNEYVYLSDHEIYMQIVDRGTGNILGTIENAEGEHTVSVLERDSIAQGTTRLINARYMEYNIAGDSIQSSNKLSPSHEQMVDEMCITYGSTSLTGSFTSGVMRNLYAQEKVPNAWLYPLYYIYLGRDTVLPTSRLARVRLIVPSTAGTQSANNYVYPCFYEIEYSAAEKVSPNTHKK